MRPGQPVGCVNDCELDNWWRVGPGRARWWEQCEALAALFQGHFLCLFRLLVSFFFCPPSDLDSTCSVPLPWQAAFMYILTNSLCQILSLSYQKQLLK